MRKRLVIGILSVLFVATTGVGAYWFFSRTRNAGQERDVQVVRVESKDDGNTDPSDEIEPLVVQRTPPVEDLSDFELRTELPVPRSVWRPDMPLPPRPDAQPGVVERMPMADEQSGIGGWFCLDWSAIKAKLSGLNIFEGIEKTEPPVAEPENKETNPPTELPPANPVPDYHQQYPHCPYHGPCPSPYRGSPRD